MGPSAPIPPSRSWGHPGGAGSAPSRGEGSQATGSSRGRGEGSQTTGSREASTRAEPAGGSTPDALGRGQRLAAAPRGVNRSPTGRHRGCRGVSRPPTGRCRGCRG
eukprot:16441437-Heterocapsa_arctica.AAC.1